MSRRRQMFRPGAVLGVVARRVLASIAVTHPSNRFRLDFVAATRPMTTRARDGVAE
tara:strand:+ start:1972 stop:2139 length:168 start_codon:yes stop_codon:yes gene_type:complete